MSELLDQLAAICPEHVYDLEVLFTARVAAAAAQAWDQGWKSADAYWEARTGTHWSHLVIAYSNPYRAGEGTPAGGGE